MKLYKILFCVPTLFLSLNSFAESYQRCSEEQTSQIMQQFKFDQLNKFKKYAESKTSCLNINENTQLLAMSNPITQLDEYEDGEFDLQLFLIDQSQHKILQKTKDNYRIESDADHFDGIQLDINRFSTLPNTDVIALKINHSHHGGFTYGYESLNLYKVSRTQAFRFIFEGVGTHDYGYVNGSCGEHNSSSDVNRIFILSNKITHGLQDIILKEKKNQVITGDKKCESKTNVYKQQQTLKFNGKEYKLQHDHLLGIDPF